MPCGCTGDFAPLVKKAYGAPPTPVTPATLGRQPVPTPLTLDEQHAAGADWAPGQGNPEPPGQGAGASFVSLLKKILGMG